MEAFSKLLLDIYQKVFNEHKIEFNIYFTCTNRLFRLPGLVRGRLDIGKTKQTYKNE